MREERLNLLGHLYTYDWPMFFKFVSHGDKTTIAQFISFGRSHACIQLDALLSIAEWEQKYRNYDEMAYAWQHGYTDEHDDDDLMSLLRLLRSTTSSWNGFD